MFQSGVVSSSNLQSPFYVYDIYSYIGFLSDYADLERQSHRVRLGGDDKGENGGEESDGARVLEGDEDQSEPADEVSR
jgi:hypothetical protein